MHSHLGVLGVTGFLMKDIDRQSARLRRRRPAQCAPRGDLCLARLDQPRSVRVRQTRRQDDRRHRHQRHARVPGRAARLLPVGDRQDGPRGRSIEFARFFVIPQTGHGLTGSSYTANGDGQTISATQIPSRFDRVAMLLDWVEKGTPPPRSATVTGSAGSLPLCSYPTYPKYNSGARTEAASYACAVP